MFTLRTLTTVGLVLVLAAGASAAERKGRSGNSHAKAKVQQPNRSRQFAKSSAGKQAANTQGMKAGRVKHDKGTFKAVPPAMRGWQDDDENLDGFPRFQSTKSRGKPNGGKLNVVPDIEEDDIDTEEVAKIRARSSNRAGNPGKFGPQNGLTPPLGNGKGNYTDGGVHHHDNWRE